MLQQTPWRLAAGVNSASISGGMNGRLEDFGDDMPYVVTDVPN